MENCRVQITYKRLPIALIPCDSHDEMMKLLEIIELLDADTDATGAADMID